MCIIWHMNISTKPSPILKIIQVYLLYTVHIRNAKCVLTSTYHKHSNKIRKLTTSSSWLDIRTSSHYLGICLSSLPWFSSPNNSLWPLNHSQICVISMVYLKIRALWGKPESFCTWALWHMLCVDFCCTNSLWRQHKLILSRELGKTFSVAFALPLCHRRSWGRET